MASVTSLISKARRLVDDYPQLDALSPATLTSGATTLAVTDGTLYKAGMVLSIEEEALLVSSVATNTLTLVRGYRGTTAAQHLQGAPILVDVRFTAADYLDGLNEGLRQLWPAFFKYVTDTSLATDGSTVDFAIPASMSEGRLLRVSVLFSGGAAEDYKEDRRWEVIRGGGSNTLHLVGSALSAGTLKLIGVAPFNTDMTVAGSTDSELPDRAVQLLPRYAAFYVLSSGEARRLASEHARNVGPGAVQVQANSTLARQHLQDFERMRDRSPMPIPTFYTRRRGL